MFKRSALRAHATAAMHLKDAAGKPMFFTPAAAAPGEEVKKLPVLITLHGPGSEVNLNAQQDAKRRLLAWAKDSGKDLQSRDPAQRAGDVADVLAAITAGVDGLDLEGKSVSAGVRDLYADPLCGYIVDQVNAFAADWANFSNGAPKA